MASAVPADRCRLDGLWMLQTNVGVLRTGWPVPTSAMKMEGWSVTISSVYSLVRKTWSASFTKKVLVDDVAMLQSGEV